MDRKTPLVSAILPTYNRDDLLPEAIDSVLEQTYENIELIVVDDGSTDNTKQVLAAYGNKIKYFHKTNGGNADARNYGINKATGKYIAFLDHDDLWYPERLEKLVEFMENNSQYGAVISEVEFVNMNRETVGYSSYKIGFPSDGSTLSYMLKNLLGLFSNLVTKKEVVFSIGEIDEAMKAASDIDYFLRIAVNHKIALYNKSLLKYRKTDASFSNKIFTKNRLNVLSKFKRQYPQIARKYSRIIKKTIARIHLSYADDLLWHRYVKEARRQLLESLHSHFTLKAIKLFIKSLVIEFLSFILPGYRDKGRFCKVEKRIAKAGQKL